VSSCENDSAVLALTSPLPLPRPPKKKINNLPKNVSPSNFHQQCADPGIDPISSPHPRIQCSGPLQKDPHPEPASDRVLTTSRTRISRPLAIVREQRRARSNNLPRRNATTTCAHTMGQDYPFTGPSPGANPLIYPSSLPRVLGKLSGNILPKDI
jgi:hypothetical protein